MCFSSFQLINPLLPILPNMTLLQLSAQEGRHYPEDMARLHSKGTFQTNGEGKPAPERAVDILIML